MHFIVIIFYYYYRPFQRQQHKQTFMHMRNFVAQM